MPEKSGAEVAPSRMQVPLVHVFIVGIKVLLATRSDVINLAIV